jgi:flagellar biogenesis protein FliO
MLTETLRIRPGTPGAWLGALWERVLRISRRTPKGLRLCESLPLGERRFVAVVEFEKARFLVGGTASSLVLLSRLADSGEPAEGQRDGNDNQGGGKC